MWRNSNLQRGRAAAWPRRSRAAAAWLFLVAAVVVAMVVVGGATRATGSGLSITRWDPIVGVVPPLTAADWRHAFALYQATPQYRIVNLGISMAEFQSLFWWEWAHRLLGRIIGIVFFVPFVALLAARRLPRRLWWPCLGLFLLGGLQGYAGWRMVSSGLSGRVLVAPEWLAIHLGLALTLLAGLILAGLAAWAGPPGRRAPLGGWRLAAIAAAALVFLQCLAGALVAGAHAGLVEGDWPLMGGRLVPADYWGGSLAATLLRNPASIQLHHRLIAYALLAFVTLAAAAAITRARRRPRRALGWLGLAALAWGQGVLGVLLLRWSVPLLPALAHQLNAILIFLAALVLAWASGREPRGIMLPREANH